MILPEYFQFTFVIGQFLYTGDHVDFCMYYRLIHLSSLLLPHDLLRY